jgi:hypothetical protein
LESFCLFSSGQLLAAAPQASVAGPGWKKIQILDLGSAINNLDHIFQSFVTIIWVKNVYIFCSGSGIQCLFDPGSGMEKL